MDQRNDVDIEDQDQTMEDKTFALTVQKMKSKTFPTNTISHVSEMSKFTDYEENKFVPPISNLSGRQFKI